MSLTGYAGAAGGGHRNAACGIKTTATEVSANANAESVALGLLTNGSAPHPRWCAVRRARCKGKTTRHRSGASSTANYLRVRGHGARPFCQFSHRAASVEEKHAQSISP